MRKIFLVIAVLLLAAPAWATVSVTCTAVDPGNTYKVQVDYAVTSDVNNIRAFGIRIDVNNGAVISDVNVISADYYIFPGSIVIDSNGDVNNWGSAVAEGGNGSAYLILEMGSLYAANDVSHPCEPPQSGILCTFETSKECVVTLSNDTTRGGVVMEDGSDYASLSSDIVPYADCLSQSHPDWAAYDAVGRPDCWCNPRQCHGDAANDKEGTTKLGFWYVGDNDLNILIPGWKIKEPPDGVGIATITGPNGEPGICADFFHDKEGTTKLGYWYIGDNDLNRLIPYWKEKEVPDGNGVPADCL